MKNYNQSPLPFQGQKRRFVNQFKSVLNGFSEHDIFIDLFGGSGLLAHTAKQCYPQTKVIYNDYDNFQVRLKAIPQTNELLAVLRVLLTDLPRGGKLSHTLKEHVLKCVKRHEKKYGYVDYITLSASLLFSAKYVTDYEGFANETMWNRIKVTDYDATGYLDGVELVNQDYKVIYEEYKSNHRVVWLVDPPYLSTDVSTYGNEDYWRLRDYLDVLNVVDGHRYVYFTSNKSQIVELCEWIETRTFTGNPFSNASISTTSNRLNHNSGYTDIMLYDYKKSPD